jgi:hypothetical protein
MSTSAGRLATYEDLLRLSEDVRAEVFGGHVVDLEARTLEALELAGERWVEMGAYDETTRAQIPPFSEITFEVGRVFLPAEADEPPREGV